MCSPHILKLTATLLLSYSEGALLNVDELFVEVLL